MIVTTANCPSCGGPITFKLGSSIAVICEYCGSAIARTDRDIRNLGKVADLIDTRSPLRVGLEGRFENRPFTLTGRVQIAHPAGGVWDEWYAAFDGGGWGWLAESQGRFHMTFYRAEAAGGLPPFEALAPGRPIQLPGAPAPFVVAEANFGRVVSGEGEIPYAVQPGLTYRFGDLSGPGGAFATIDYRDQSPSLFAGREVTLAEMRISTDVDEFDAKQKRVAVERLTCPHCNGPLELRAPGASLRVTCPNCNSLLDVNQGNLTYLRTLEQGRQQRFPNGATGIVDGVELTLVGFMVRGCQVEGTWYYWEEYLLYNPAVGFRWIVNGEGGWYYVEPAAAGDVAETGSSPVRFHGKRFMLKETVVAHVVYVRGEFYWRVEVGEQATASDFISQNEMLSKEISAGEINWSFGRRIDVLALDRAFDPRQGRANPLAVPPPRVYTPPPPLPSMWGACGVWLLLTVLAFGVALGLAAMTKEHTVLSQSASFGAETVPPRPPAPPAPDSDSEVQWVPAKIEQKIVLGSFSLDGKGEIKIDVDAEGDGMLYLQLVNDVNGGVQSQYIGAYDHTETFKNPGAGQYTLYAIRTYSEENKDMQVSIKLTEGSSDNSWAVLASLILLIGPALLFIAKAIRTVFSE
jgi:hypothetical protein